MKLYAPQYYKNFKCIADKCEKSCCIGWEIDIDKATYEKYQNLKNYYSSTILNSISLENTPHFKLCARDRCPHLNEKGLCEIILNVGEDYLCDICREHPRFYNYTKVAEVGVGMSCQEAARLILSSSNYSIIEEIGEIDANEDEIDFEGITERQNIYEILQTKELDYNAKLEKIYAEYDISCGNDEDWLEIINSLEYLEESHKVLFNNYSADLRPEAMDAFLERALAYFIYRHCTEAVDEDDFSYRLSFCLFCERLLASLICFEKATTLQDVAGLASIISEEIEYSEDNTELLIYH